MRLLLGCFVLVAGLAGCCLVDPEREYQIHVDSVSAPSAIAAGAPLTVKVYGWAGGDGCHQFKEFRVERSNAGAFVSVVGHVEDGICTMAPHYMDGRELSIAPPFTDPFQLHFRQPQGGTLDVAIRVE